jgi:hypothetical protein
MPGHRFDVAATLVVLLIAAAARGYGGADVRRGYR